MSGLISVINLKGGCGKTTVATHLAAAFALSGLDTALADFDRQKNALLWHKLRGRRKPRIRVVDWRDKFGKVPKGALRLVVDCPASLRARNAREVVKQSDLVVVPVLPSIYDERSTEMFLKNLEALKQVRKGRKPILLVANRYRPNSAAAKRLEEFVLAKQHLLVARIPDRAVYPAAAEEGLTVFDYSTNAAREQQNMWLPLLAAVEERLHPGVPLPIA
jgi:chromosome partitioning protein